MIVTEESFKDRQHTPKYVLNFWGSIRNSDAKMPLGTKGSHYWCDTPEEIESIKSEISEIAKKTPSYHGISSCVLFSVYPSPDEDWSEFTDKSTVAVVSLDHLGIRYVIEYDFGYGYPESSARFMFEEGNYSCDCNLSSFIQGVCNDFPSMDCGDEIKIASIEIEYR